MKTLVTVLSIVVLVIFVVALTAWATRPGEAAFTEHLMREHGISESMILERSGQHLKVDRGAGGTTTFNWFFRDKSLFTRFYLFSSTVGNEVDPAARTSGTTGYLGVFGIFFEVD